MITIDDFAKLDIRVGTIVSAEKVEGADKLLKLEVDLGEEVRQIMAGIAEYYENPKELIEKQIPVIVNLEYRKLKGFESQGMMLAAGTDEKPVLLHPAEKVPNGSKLS